MCVSFGHIRCMCVFHLAIAFFHEVELFQSPDIRTNGHFGGEYDRGYESGFTNTCLLHNFQIISSVYHTMDA